MTTMRWMLIVCLGLAAPVIRAEELSPEQRAKLSRNFGFQDMQIYKIENGVSDLVLEDLNNDGKIDIALWNPYDNRIELFYQPGPDAEQSDRDEGDLEPNELPDRGDLVRENAPVAYRIGSLAAGEFTGDERTDLVFFGEPKELVVLPGKEEGGFGPASGIRAPDGAARGGALAVGDFNHDGQDDVALLGADHVLLFLQRKDGGLNQPEKIVHTISGPLIMLADDIDGDGRDDLLISADDDQHGLYVLLQSEAGKLGAVQQLRVPRVRSVTLAHNPDGKADLYVNEAATNRMKHYRWGDAPDAAGATDWASRLYSYPLQTRGKERPLVVGDIDDDGWTDVVAADAEAAQLFVFRGTARGLNPAEAYPGLLGTSNLAIANVDHSGKPEVLSVSAKERLIGVSEFEGGRLTFPRPLTMTGAPLAAAFGPLKSDGAPALVYVVRGDEESADDRDAPVRLVVETDSAPVSLELEDLRDDVTGLRLADVDQDGDTDVLLFVAYSPLRTYLQGNDGKFTRLSGGAAREALVKDARPSGYAYADVTGDRKPEVLLAQERFARALVVKEGRWTVVDQYNPQRADAQLTGLAVVEDDHGSAPTLVLYDRRSGELLELSHDEDGGAYEVTKAMPVGDFEVTAMEATRIGNEMRVLLADARRLALFTPGRRPKTFVEQQAYESDIEDAWLGDVVVADVNGDEIRDLIVVEMRKANLEILTTLPDGKWAKALHFQVFQGKRFSGEPNAGGQPRQVLADDVTGDGIDDIVLLVHDRLIVYPGM